MARECAFILPSGKKCRCMANRHHKFCRHHGAPFRRRSLPAEDQPWSRLACWRDTVRSLPTWPKEEIPGQLLQVLWSLMENCISDRTAGRILRTLLQRYGDLPLIPASEAGLEPSGVLGHASANQSGNRPGNAANAPARSPNLAVARAPIAQLPDLDNEAIDRFIAQFTPKK